MNSTKHTIKPASIIVILLIGIQLLVGFSKPGNSIVYQSETLAIERVTNNVFKHISYLQTESFGNVACNGMVYINKGEAIVFDTPTNNKVSAELIKWLTTTRRCIVKAIVVTHFHDDCLGGLEEFHKQNIPSYAYSQTIALATKEQLTIPQHSFDQQTELTIGKQQVIIGYFGAGHTPDNVVGYLPKEKVLFGGCLIKAQGADKGYLGDANVTQWPVTVEKIKEAYPKVKNVIPGHGDTGGQELLDYTIQLFANTP